MNYLIALFFIASSLQSYSLDIPNENVDSSLKDKIHAFDSRAEQLVNGIAGENYEKVAALFFPEKSFEILKDIKGPLIYYKTLVKWYNADLEREHLRFKDSTLTFKSFELGRCKWKDKGSEYNKIAYWSCSRSKIKVSHNGKEESIDVKALINWGDEWFITHLGPIPKN